MAKGYSYIRFSTPEQAKGHSKSRQTESCERFCADHEIDLARDEEYTFFDSGKSAFSGDHVSDNGQLARFLKMVESGAIERGSYLIVESLDRLSREHVMEALPRFMALLRAGINIVTLADSKVYDSKTNIMEIMYSVMIMGRAHDESSTKAMRLGAAWKAKQEKARIEKAPIGNACPQWLRYSKDGQCYEIREDRASSVQRVFDLAIAGYGKAVIAKMLNAEGIAAFKGGTWGASSVDKLLNNRAVLGEYLPHSKAGKSKREPIGAPIEGYFPAIIDSATFYAARAAIEGRRVSKATKQSKRCNVWQGIARCWHCDSPMHLINKGSTPKGNTYLACAKSRKGLCNAKMVRLDRSELVVREVLAKVDSLALVQDASTKIMKDLAEVDGRLSEQRKKLKELQELLENARSISLAASIARCEGEIQSLELRRTELLTALAADRIVDKDDFLSRLDLDSYEGRSKANTLLKRLKIQVHIRAMLLSGGRMDSYRLSQNGDPQVDITEKNGQVLSLPLTLGQMAKTRELDLHSALISNSNKDALEGLLNSFDEILHPLK
jgi:DNA invertase Pin-like site-specific DNA recombinase